MALGGRAVAFLICGALVSLIVVPPSCREATSVVIEARTNVVYRSGFSTSFTVGAPGTTETSEPVAEVNEPWRADGFVGSLVVVPESSDDATVALKVVLGVRRAARQCAPPAYDGCIVARRRIRYVAHERLRVPITLYAHCENVPCNADSTCNHLGACVPSAIDSSKCEESETGCLLEGDRPNDVPPRVDVPISDAASDGEGGPVIPSGKDASSSGDSSFDAADAAGLAGYVHCPDVGFCSPGFSCCTSTSTPGYCVEETSQVCTPNEATFRCDGQEDCVNLPNYVCCVFGQDARCRPSQGCMQQGGVEVCHSNGACSIGACTGRKHNGIYLTCSQL